MENSVLINLSRQTVMQRYMDIIANNIANSSTAGYKSEQLLFAEYVSRSGPGGQSTSYVQDTGVVRDYREGAITKTRGTLDLAIRGKGWFVIDTPEGHGYTRDGHFRLNEKGRLTTVNGDPVLNSDNAPIQFTPGETNIEIISDGTIHTSLGRKARINIVTFEDEQKLNKASGNLYTTDSPTQPALRARVLQGMIEASNVEPIIQITRMIEAMRSFQGAQRFFRAEVDLQIRAILTLADQGT